MRERIIAIREVKADWQKADNYPRETVWEGYEVFTSERTIRCMIDAEQQCCEHWGYLWSNDDVNEYVGATLLKVTRTDEALVTEDVEDGHDDYDDETSSMFVTFETDIGRLQFTLYNAHNGYYSHPVRIDMGNGDVYEGNL